MAGLDINIGNTARDLAELFGNRDNTYPAELMQREINVILFNNTINRGNYDHSC